MIIGKIEKFECKEKQDISLSGNGIRRVNSEQKNDFFLSAIPSVFATSQSLASFSFLRERGSIIACNTVSKFKDNYTVCKFQPKGISLLNRLTSK